MMTIVEYETQIQKAEDTARSIYQSFLKSGYDEESARTHVKQIMTESGRMFDQNDICCSHPEYLPNIRQLIENELSL